MFKDLLKLKENDVLQEAWNLVRAEGSKSPSKLRSRPELLQQR